MSESKQRLERENRELRGDNASLANEAVRLRWLISDYVGGSPKAKVDVDLMLIALRASRPKPEPRPAPASAKTAAILAMAAAVIPN